MPRSRNSAGKPSSGFWSPNRLARRTLARAGGLAFLAITILYGLVVGGHLEQSGGPLARLPGVVAGYFGYAAEDIRISGLKWQSRDAVLTAIGIRPGGSLVGFEAARAKRLLENLDWVKSAHVQRLFPNQLEIRLVERQPFAVWQRDGSLYVIDDTGAALTSVRPQDVPHLLLVTGEGAQAAAAELVNQLEAHAGLRSKLKAAARVGDRRWNLYFAGPVKVLLPETGMRKALQVLKVLDERNKLLEKQVSAIDLRLPASAVISPPPSEKADEMLVVGRR
jgi:cell division protein FtsQ